jgi:hypothetical protein
MEMGKSYLEAGSVQLKLLNVCPASDANLT